MRPLTFGFGLRTLPGCQPHEVKTSPRCGELAEAAPRPRPESSKAQAAEGLDRVVQWGIRKPSPAHFSCTSTACIRYNLAYMSLEQPTPEAPRQLAAWAPDYEHSAWLDVDDKTIQVEGDPETPEGFGEAYRFLHVVTVYFKTEHGSASTATQRGLWWTVTAEDIKAEVEHRNQWATWDARRKRQTDETAVATAIELAHVLALSYRRLQALQGIGGAQRPEYPLFLHLHEKIREARLKEAELEQVLRIGQEPPLLSPFLRTLVWKLLEETHEHYDPDTHTNTVIYGDEAQVRYGVEVIDPFQPHRPETEYKREMHYFPHQEQAVAVQYEYQHMGYWVGALDDYQENITIAEPWEEAMY